MSEEERVRIGRFNGWWYVQRWREGSGRKPPGGEWSRPAGYGAYEYGSFPSVVWEWLRSRFGGADG